MAHLHLRLLGSPQVVLNGTSIELATRKVLALLTYLAVTGQAHSRDALATLFWPEADQARARSSLRHALANLKVTLGNDWLEMKGDRVSLYCSEHLTSDIAQFITYLNACQTHGHREHEVCPACVAPLTSATRLYAGDFMAGFSLSDSPEFDQWQYLQLEGLRRDLASALARLVDHHVSQQAWEEATGYPRRWVALDPLHEPAQRRLMQVYAWAGQRAAALHIYQECVRLLEEELGVPPEDKTDQLYEAIRVGGLPPSAVSTLPLASASMVTSSLTTSLPPHNLPSQSSPFFGRTKELFYILARLADPDCRLLTISGPGGIGKTRLAIRAAYSALTHPSGTTAYTHGVYFVSLAAVTSPELLAPRVAETIGLTFYGDADPQSQLQRYLRDRSMLLVLDNFEHLMEGVEFVTDILVAPGIKILVTSREALNVQEEWLCPLDGLSFPSKTQATAPNIELESYDAIRLFTQNARRIRPDFSLTTEQEHVSQICCLVEGMPLALELAAAWLKALACQTVASELQQSLDLLVTSVRNVPERHRSMRAVFEQSWHLLSAEEFMVMKGLSVFRGGFEQEAAQVATGANLRTLASLVDKSLLRMTPAGRYQIHELLRQYAEEKLAEDAAQQAEVKERHSEYYLSFLIQRAQVLMGAQQPSILEEIGQEIDNLRTGWQWAIQHGKLELIDQALGSLSDYYQLCSQYVEGLELFASASEGLYTVETNEPAQMVLGRLQARQAAFLHTLGRDEQARPLVEASLALACQHDRMPEVALCLYLLGEIVWWQGTEINAIPLLEESLACYRLAGDQVGIVTVLFSLISIYMSASEFDSARPLVEEALASSRQMNYLYGIGEALFRLGRIAFTKADYITAIKCYQESLPVLRQVGNRNRVASVLSSLGRAMYASGKFPRNTFMPYLEDALVLSHETANYRSMYTSLGHLAEICNYLGEYERARSYIQELIDVAGTTFNPHVPVALVLLGHSVVGLGQLAAGRSYLREGISLAFKTQTRAAATVPIALLAWVKLLHMESALLDSTGQPWRAQQMQEQALAIASSLLHDPKVSTYEKQQVIPLAAKLKALLPPEVAATAKSYGASMSVLEIATEFLNQEA